MFKVQRVLPKQKRYTANIIINCLLDNLPPEHPCDKFVMQWVTEPNYTFDKPKRLLRGDKVFLYHNDVPVAMRLGGVIYGDYLNSRIKIPSATMCLNFRLLYRLYRSEFFYFMQSMGATYNKWYDDNLEHWLSILKYDHAIAFTLSPLPDEYGLIKLSPANYLGTYKDCISTSLKISGIKVYRGTKTPRSFPPQNRRLDEIINWELTDLYSHIIVNKEVHISAAIQHGLLSDVSMAMQKFFPDDFESPQYKKNDSIINLLRLGYINDPDI